MYAALHPSPAMLKVFVSSSDEGDAFIVCVYHTSSQVPGQQLQISFPFYG